jgi:hypothetical protein
MAAIPAEAEVGQPGWLITGIDRNSYTDRFHGGKILLSAEAV